MRRWLLISFSLVVEKNMFSTISWSQKYRIAYIQKSIVHAIIYL